jgi:hypothetical protein
MTQRAMMNQGSNRAAASTIQPAYIMIKPETWVVRLFGFLLN